MRRETAMASMIAAALSLAAAGIVTADTKQTVATKYTQGIVSAVGKQGIAVERTLEKGGAIEMYLPFDPSIRLQGVSGVSDLHEGDTVLVDYRETTEQDGDMVRASRVAVKVALVRRAAAKAAVVEPAETEDAEVATP